MEKAKRVLGLFKRKPLAIAPPARQETTETSAHNNYCTTLDFSLSALQESGIEDLISYEAFEDSNERWTVLKVTKNSSNDGKKQRSIEILKQGSTYTEVLHLLQEKELGLTDLGYLPLNKPEDLGIDYYQTLMHRDDFIFDTDGNVHKTRHGRIVTKGNFFEDACSQAVEDFHADLPNKKADRGISLSSIFGSVSVLRKQDILQNYTTKMNYDEWIKDLEKIIKDCAKLDAQMNAIHRYLGEKFSVEEGGFAPKKDYKDEAQWLKCFFPEEKEYAGHNKTYYPTIDFNIGKKEIKDYGHKSRTGLGGGHRDNYYGPGYIEAFVEFAEVLKKSKPHVLDDNDLLILKQLRFFSSYIFAKSFYFTSWNSPDFGKQVFDHSIAMLKAHHGDLPASIRPDWKNTQDAMTVRCVEEMPTYIDQIKQTFENKLAQVKQMKHDAVVLMDSRATPQLPKPEQSQQPDTPKKRGGMNAPPHRRYR